MNKLITITIITILFLSCQKDDSFSPYMWEYWGQAFAYKNDTAWNPKIIAIQNEQDTVLYSIELHLYGINLDSNILQKPRNYMTIRGLKRSEVGIFNMTSDSNSEGIFSLFYTINGDVLGDVFTLDKTKDNFVEITEVHRNEVKGNFNISYIRDKSRPLYLETSDTLKFTEGTFHTRIIKGR